MMEKQSIIVPIIVAIITPLLKWVLDFLSESFGKRKLETLKGKIELYEKVCALIDDERVIEKFKISIHRDFENILPAEKKKVLPYFTIPYSLVFYSVTTAAVVMLCANTISFLLGIRAIYTTITGSVIASLLLLYLTTQSKKDTFKYFLPLAVVIYCLAYFMNFIGMQLSGPVSTGTA